MTETPTPTSSGAGELLACPFCGGEAFPGTIKYSPAAAKDVGDGKQLIYHTVNCVKCSATVGSQIGYPTVEQAAAHWNRRTPTHPISREAVARIIDPQAFAGPIFMDQAMRDDAAPARQASALAKADQIISPGGADESDLLLGQARFLLDRLNDFDDWSQDKDDLLRNWCGHVDPARSRLENTVAAMEAATPPSPSCLGVVEALEEIASGAARGLDDFKARMGGRKAPTWYAVNVLQDNLAACQGTARTALQSHRGEGR